MKLRQQNIDSVGCSTRYSLGEKFISANRITSTLSHSTQVPSTGHKTLIANSQFPLDCLWAVLPNEFSPSLCSFFGKYIMDEVQKPSKPTKRVSLFRMDEIEFS